ncbi:hypothetical protein LCGC14_0432790 [marine sediment metagenome]|uniref:Uncharacterized protein n=1 Tax=marine sediment metagenome TaxID=412755 RepID=A0A0F9STT4_9ZZZZ
MQGELPRFEDATVVAPGPAMPLSPQLEGLGQLGEAAMKVGITQIKSATIAQKYKVGTDIINHSSALGQEYMQKSPSVQNVGDFNKIYDQYSSATVASVLPANRPYTERMLSYHRNLITNRLALQAASVARNETAFQFQNSISTFSNQMGNLAREGARIGHSNDLIDVFKKSPPGTVSLNPATQGALSFHGQVNQLVEDGVASRMITGEQGAVYKKSANQEFTTQQLLGHYENLRQQVAQDPSLAPELPKYRNFVLTSPQFDKIYSPHDRNVTLSKMHAIDVQAAQNDGINRANLQMKIHSLHDQTIATGTPNPQLLTDIIGLKPELAVDLSHELEIDKNVHAIVQSHSENLQDATSTAIRLKNEGLVGDEAKSPYASYILASKNAASTRLKQVAQNMENNPVRFVLNRESSSGDLQAIENNPAIQNKAQAMTNYFVEHEKQMNIPDNKIQAQPMSLNITDADSIRNAVDPATGQKSLQAGLKMLNDKLSRDPDNFNYYKNGLVKAGLDTAYFDLVNIAQVPSNAVYLQGVEAALTHDSTASKDQKLTNLVVLKGTQQAVKQPNSTLKKAIFTDDSVNKYLTAINAGAHTDSSTTDSLKNTMFKYGQWLYANSNMTQDQVVKQIKTVFVTNLFSYVGRSYVVPHDQNPDSVKETMNYMDFYLKTAPIEPEGNPSLNLSHKYLTNITRENAINQGHWINDNKGNYIKTDSMGHPILLPGHRLFGFTSKQAADPNFLRKFAPMVKKIPLTLKNIETTPLQIRFDNFALTKD